MAARRISRIAWSDYSRASISSSISESSSSHHQSLKVRLLDWFFSSLCVVGAIVQIHHIAKIYFAYGTSSTIEIKIPGIINLDTFSICIRYTDILNYEQIQLDNSSRADWKLTTTADGIRKYQNELKLDELFRYTPNKTNLIEQITFRRHGSYELNTCNGIDCLGNFSVERFVYLEYICYSITPLYLNETFSYQSLALTPSAPGEIFKVQFADSMKKSELMKSLSHKPHVLPYVGLPITPVKRRAYNILNDTAKYNYFTSSTVKLVVNKLPPPHETLCRNYSLLDFTSRIQAIQDCIKTNVYSKLHKVPFSYIVLDSMTSELNKNLVSYIDTVDPKVTSLLFESERICMAKYRNDDCHLETSFTSTESNTGELFEIRLVTPSTPFTTINTAQQTNFIEFITVVMSTASTWTGLAIISFNPVSIFFTLKDKFNLILRLMKKNSISRRNILKHSLSSSSINGNNFKIQVTNKSQTSNLSDQMKTIDSNSLAYLMKYTVRQRELLQSMAHIEYRIRKLETFYIQRAYVRM